MTTTAELLLRTAELLRGLRYGTATGGSTTTLVDTAMLEPDDFFNNGTIWFLSGNNIGKSAVVSDYSLTSHTFTFATQTAACAAADRYAVLDANYPREALVAALNTALIALGPFDYVDDTLDVVANQEEYTLPAGYNNVKRVQVAAGATAPFQWGTPLRHWKELNGKLHIDYSSVTRLPTAGTPIRIIAEKQHARVWADADTITDAVRMDRLALEAAYFAAMTRSEYTENSSNDGKDTLDRLEKLRAMSPAHVLRMCKDPTLAK